jgi:hypothetical protein
MSAETYITRAPEERTEHSVHDARFGGESCDAAMLGIHRSCKRIAEKGRCRDSALGTT